jgi:hypothetical protein
LRKEAEKATGSSARVNEAPPSWRRSRFVSKSPFVGHRLVSDWGILSVMAMKCACHRRASLVVDQWIAVIVKELRITFAVVGVAIAILTQGESYVDSTIAGRAEGLPCGFDERARLLRADHAQTASWAVWRQVDEKPTTSPPRCPGTPWAVSASSPLDTAPK